MHNADLSSALGTVIVAVPFLLVSFLAFFRLDEVIAAPKSKSKRARPFCGTDENGDLILSDPDGRLWGKPQLR
jgi:hypothetical protein